jgi:hypothetical protein
MKRLYSLDLVVICIIIVSLFIFTKAICDDEDTLLDTPPYEGYYYYSYLLKSSLSQLGILFELYDSTVLPRQNISYLERQEKSPPLILSTIIL